MHMFDLYLPGCEHVAPGTVCKSALEWGFRVVLVWSIFAFLLLVLVYCCLMGGESNKTNKAVSDGTLSLASSLLDSDHRQTSAALPSGPKSGLNRSSSGNIIFPDNQPDNQSYQNENLESVRKVI